LVAASPQPFLEEIMSSVRLRIEQAQREAAEKTVETGTRRVALGASGPTLSTRQREQIASDAAERLEPSPHTRTGGTDYMGGNMSRVRDRQAATSDAVEAAKPRPRTEFDIAFDAANAEIRRRQEREAREERERLAKIAARKKQEADEQRAASLKAMYMIEGATAEEKAIVDNLMRCEGKYGDVNAHLAKLMTLRWTLGEQQEETSE
jgi:hypothetical protein